MRELSEGCTGAQPLLKGVLSTSGLMLLYYDSCPLHNLDEVAKIKPKFATVFPVTQKTENRKNGPNQAATLGFKPAPMQVNG